MMCPLLLNAICYKPDKSLVHVLIFFVALLGSGPEGVDDLCFHTYGEFSPPSSSSSPSPPLTQILL